MQSVNMDQQQTGKGPPADGDVVLTPMSFYQFPVPEFSENTLQEQESGDDVILIPSDSHQPCESLPGIVASIVT